MHSPASRKAAIILIQLASGVEHAAKSQRKSVGALYAPAPTPTPRFHYCRNISLLPLVQVANGHSQSRPQTSQRIPNQVSHGVHTHELDPQPRIVSVTQPECHSVLDLTIDDQFEPGNHLAQPTLASARRLARRWQESGCGARDHVTRPL